MAGTKAGGLKAAQKNMANDPDFYRRIGSIGGKNGNTGGSAADRELARRAGAKGGRVSKRGKKKVIMMTDPDTGETKQFKEG